MIRGTTPIFRMTIKDKDGAAVDVSGYTAEFNLRQGEIVITKTVAGPISPFEIRLTQEETMMFSHTRPAFLQVRLRQGIYVKASQTVQIPVEELQSEAVM